MKEKRKLVNCDVQVSDIKKKKMESGLCAVSALMTFKEAIFEDPHKVLSSWNGLELGSDPCNWDGITCSGDRAHVTKM